MVRGETRKMRIEAREVRGEMREVRVEARAMRVERSGRGARARARERGGNAINQNEYLTTGEWWEKNKQTQCSINLNSQDPGTRPRTWILI